MARSVTVEAIVSMTKPRKLCLNSLVLLWRGAMAHVPAMNVISMERTKMGGVSAQKERVQRVQKRRMASVRFVKRAHRREKGVSAKSAGPEHILWKEAATVPLAPQAGSLRRQALRGVTHARQVHMKLTNSCTTIAFLALLHPVEQTHAPSVQLASMRQLLVAALAKLVQLASLLKVAAQAVPIARCVLWGRSQVK